MGRRKVNVVPAHKCRELVVRIQLNEVQAYSSSVVRRAGFCITAAAAASATTAAAACFPTMHFDCRFSNSTMALVNNTAWTTISITHTTYPPGPVPTTVGLPSMLLLAAMHMGCLEGLGPIS